MENSVQTKVFKPNQRIEFLEERYNLIGWIILLTGIFFLIIEFYIVGISIMLGLGGICHVLAFDKWNKIEKPKGSFPFELVFREEEISLGGLVYRLSDIKITKLICYDYVGRSGTGFVFHVKYPKKSCGTWNHLWFTKDEKEYKLRFQIKSKADSKEISAIKIKWGLS
ncbi:hypothetical protein ACFSKL_22690 [Belliella marina]|uniref:Uncharacterized protein n=1 Tax=Belliella marina TaxID=1644146 RepID=A0ABW4VXI4_9BACT